ncbi:MAG TPA: hypothetical protein PKD54_06710 [Pirellulaceae bacterium]|nr:hypothetical protein [Pirellulaceae bacterium]
MSPSEYPESLATAEVDELLTAYLDEELSVEERSSVEQRLSDDSAFRARLAELERAWNALDDLPRAAPSHSFTRSTVELAVAELSREIRLSQPRWKRWIPQMLSIVVLPIVVLWGAYAVTHSMRMAPYRQLVQELDLIEHFEMYEKIDCDLEYLELLGTQGIFGGGNSDGSN